MGKLMTNKFNNVLKALDICSKQKNKKCNECPYFIKDYGECRDLDLIQDCREQLEQFQDYKKQVEDYKELLNALHSIGLAWYKE